MERQLFFLILSLFCLWIILDQIAGKHYLGNTIRRMFL